MQSENIKATLAALRADGFMCEPRTCAHCLAQAFTVDEKDTIRRAFDRGNFTCAYETQDLSDFGLDEMSAHERAAFVLGFFSSYSLDEIDDRETYDESYWSPAGRYVVNVARYIDSRDDEYNEESEAF
jgi:hypothetical protein